MKQHLGRFALIAGVLIGASLAYANRDTLRQQLLSLIGGEPSHEQALAPADEVPTAASPGGGAPWEPQPAGEPTANTTTLSGPEVGTSYLEQMHKALGLPAPQRSGKDPR